MKQVSFKFDQQVSEDKWIPFNGVDKLVLDTTLTDPKELLPLVQESVDYHWNSKLREFDKPRRATEVVKVENYVEPKKNWDKFDPYEDDEDDFDERY
jgi:hypothetical protein